MYVLQAPPPPLCSGRACSSTRLLILVMEQAHASAWYVFRVRFSLVRVCFDSRNVQKSVTQIIYLWPLPRTALSPVFGVPDQIPSQPSRIPSQSVRVSGSPGVASHGSESASGRVGSFAGACNTFLLPECFSLLAVRCIPLPQPSMATGPSPGAGYRAGAGGILQYPEVGRMAVWIRLPRSAARSASHITRAVGSSQSRQQ